MSLKSDITYYLKLKLFNSFNQFNLTIIIMYHLLIMIKFGELRYITRNQTLDFHTAGITSKQYDTIRYNYTAT